MYGQEQTSKPAWNVSPVRPPFSPILRQCLPGLSRLVLNSLKELWFSCSDSLEAVITILADKAWLKTLSFPTTRALLLHSSYLYSVPWIKLRVLCLLGKHSPVTGVLSSDTVMLSLTNVLGHLHNNLGKYMAWSKVRHAQQMFKTTDTFNFYNILP